MNAIEVKQLIHRCAQIGLINPSAIHLSPKAIARLINLTVAIVRQEDIEALLALIGDFATLPTPESATLITVGITEQLIKNDKHLARWFLDLVLRDAAPELRTEMALALQ